MMAGNAMTRKLSLERNLSIESCSLLFSPPFQNVLPSYNALRLAVDRWKLWHLWASNMASFVFRANDRFWPEGISGNPAAPLNINSSAVNLGLPAIMARIWTSNNLDLVEDQDPSSSAAPCVHCSTVVSISAPLLYDTYD